MGQRELQQFGGYRKADELFDLVAADAAVLRKFPECYRLVGQQIASTDSICANIEEGYGRESSKEFTHFLVIARASSRETRGRYHRLRHWLGSETVLPRLSLCDEVIGILTKTIQTMRSRNNPTGDLHLKSQTVISSSPATRHPPLATRP
jgi:four helix bundle protein